MNVYVSRHMSYATMMQTQLICKCLEVLHRSGANTRRSSLLRHFHPNRSLQSHFSVKPSLNELNLELEDTFRGVVWSGGESSPLHRQPRHEYSIRPNAHGVTDAATAGVFDRQNIQNGRIWICRFACYTDCFACAAARRRRNHYTSKMSHVRLY